MTIYEKLVTHRAEILRIAAQHGAYNVRVFGSVARHDAGEESDIDFLVIMERGRTLLDMGGLLAELEELLGCSVDIVTEGGGARKFPRRRASGCDPDRRDRRMRDARHRILDMLQAINKIQSRADLSET